MYTSKDEMKHFEFHPSSIDYLVILDLCPSAVSEILALDGRRFEALHVYFPINLGSCTFDLGDDSAYIRTHGLVGGPTLKHDLLSLTRSIYSNISDHR